MPSPRSAAIQPVRQASSSFGFHHHRLPSLVPRRRILPGDASATGFFAVIQTTIGGQAIAVITGFAPIKGHHYRKWSVPVSHHQGKRRAKATAAARSTRCHGFSPTERGRLPEAQANNNFRALNPTSSNKSPKSPDEWSQRSRNLEG